MPKSTPQLRPLLWVGSSKRDYEKFPDATQELLGFELYLAQTGQHPPSAKPLKGFAGAVVELLADQMGDTYRAVYTIRYRQAVYVLHAFKKKSKRGIATPLTDLRLIDKRLRDAAADFRLRFEGESQ